MTEIIKFFGAMKQVQSVLPVEEQECLFFLLEKMKQHTGAGGSESDEQGKKIFIQYFRLHRQFEAHKCELSFVTSEVLKISPEEFYDEAKDIYRRLKV